MVAMKMHVHAWTNGAHMHTDNAFERPRLRIYRNDNCEHVGVTTLKQSVLTAKHNEPHVVLNPLHKAQAQLETKATECGFVAVNWAN